MDEKIAPGKERQSKAKRSITFDNLPVLKIFQSKRGDSAHQGALQFLFLARSLSFVLCRWNCPLFLLFSHCLGDMRKSKLVRIRACLLDVQFEALP